MPSGPQSAGSPSHQPTKSPIRQFRRILLIRLRQIGDVVFTTPAVRALREHFPDAHLAYVVEPAAASIVRRNPHLNEVIVASRRAGVGQPGADLGLVRQLRRDRYDLAIDFHGGPRASLLTWLSGAPVRVGYAVAGRSWMYTVRVPRTRVLRPRHSVLNQWDLLAALGLSAPDPARFPVEMAADPAAVARVADRLARAGVTGSHALIVVHVSAGNPFRRWPIEEFVTLVSTLAARGANRRVILTSGPSEAAAAVRTADLARVRLDAAARDRVVVTGEFSLDELRALFDSAALFIGGDSGPLHIAATTRIPIVGLYGPTLPARSAPWRDPALSTEAVEVEGLPCRPCDQRACQPGDFRCLTRLSSSRVREAAERALARGKMWAE